MRLESDTSPWKKVLWVIKHPQPPRPNDLCFPVPMRIPVSWPFLFAGLEIKKKNLALLNYLSVRLKKLLREVLEERANP